MWQRNTRPSMSETTVVDMGGPTAKDIERVEKILASVSMDTFQIAQRLREGMGSQTNFRDINDSQTRNFILNVFDDIRREAFREAAGSARRIATLSSRAAEELPEGHQRVVAKVLADMFEQFAGQLDRREPANLA